MSLNVRGELAHGSGGAPSSRPPAPPPSYLVQVPPRSAFEVVPGRRVSGRRDARRPGARLGAERLDRHLPVPACAVGQDRRARCAGGTRRAGAVTQMVRVRSRGCATDCRPDDTYRLRAYEASASFARFNHDGGPARR